MQNHQIQQVKSRLREGWLFLFILIFVISGMLAGCGASESSEPQEDSVIVIEQQSQADAAAESTAEKPNESQTPEASLPEESQPASFVLQVEAGEYLTHIMDKIEALELEAGNEIYTEDLLVAMQESIDPYLQDNGCENPEQLGLAGEGYIAPGNYEISTEMSAAEVMDYLFGQSQTRFSEEDRERAEELGYSMHEILTMASIIEFESSRTDDDSVKALVSSVIHNRLDSDTPLQMDVTVFYLQEGLLPYRDPAEYEAAYDTYEAASLPPGPICAPSDESIQAALYPEDTEYFFFIYDDEGNYYFAEDYDTHLLNVETYLD